jgi:hypothetical protein
MMRRLGKTSVRRIAALAVAGLISVWGIGTSAAQEHHGDHHGGHGGDHHGTTTTRPGGTTSTTHAPNPGERRTTVRYGPYTIQAAPDNPDGTHGHVHSGNQFDTNVQKPCTNCYITSMTADLIKADGTRAGFSNNLQLHHMVLFNRETGRTDATCPSGLGLLGQRFFASGDERLPHTLPAGYGYRIGSSGTWNLIWDLASMSRVPETVYYTVTFDWVPASTPGMRDVEPIWLDVDQCADSQVRIPAGPSQQTWVWNVNRPGDIVGIGGHVHDHGIRVEVRNDSTGQVICNSVAGYGEDPLYVDHHGEGHISSMDWCGGRGATRPVASVQTGQRVRITSHYNAPAPVDDAMGISVGYIAQGGSGGGGDSSCVTATNQQHVAAGRATSWLLFTWARGSNDYLGLSSATTSLRQSTPGNWTRVLSC